MSNPYLDMVSARTKAVLDMVSGKTPLAVKRPRRRVSTVRIVGGVMQLSSRYGADLHRAFDRAVEQLARVKQPGKAPSEDPAAIIGQMAESMTARASLYMPKAAKLGRDLALKAVGADPTLTNQQAQALVQAQIEKNARFVRESLAADLLAAYHDAPDAGAMLEAGDAMDARVGMYAQGLWSVSSEQFGTTVAAEDGEVWWVVTSDAPCADCPPLEDGSPYGPGNPLPTYPGAGATECRTNCLCLLEAEAREQAASADAPSAKQAESDLSDWSDAELEAALELLERNDWQPSGLSAGRA
jgi:hypothetical protein